MDNRHNDDIEFDLGQQNGEEISHDSDVWQPNNPKREAQKCDEQDDLQEQTRRYTPEPNKGGIHLAQSGGKSFRRPNPRIATVSAVSDYERAKQEDGKDRYATYWDKRKIILTVAAILLAIGMIFAGWKLISILLGYQRDRSLYNDLADKAISMLAEQDEEEDPEATPSASGEIQTESEIPISVDWEYLKSVNTEIIGWLYCPDTLINYPVMQTSDNSYYLYRNYNKDTASSGALFADMDSVVGVIHSNLIVYGHNMKDNSMFGTLENYTNSEFYEEHPVMYFLTPYANYRVDLVAAHIVEATSDSYNLYFQTDSEYQEYLDYITSHSTFKTSATITTEYQLLTMSTCDYSSNYEDPRLLVHGLMVPIT